MTTARDALARSICARICDERRSHDELRVMDRVLSRLEMGAESYGPLDIANDSRLWRREAADELTDLLFYLSAHKIAEDDIDRERIEREWSAACDTPSGPDDDHGVVAQKPFSTVGVTSPARTRHVEQPVLNRQDSGGTRQTTSPFPTHPDSPSGSHDASHRAEGSAGESAAESAGRTFNQQWQSEMQEAIAAGRSPANEQCRRWQGMPCGQCEICIRQAAEDNAARDAQPEFVGTTAELEQMLDVVDSDPASHPTDIERGLAELANAEVE